MDDLKATCDGLRVPEWVWDLLKPALIAMIVALLVSLGAQPRSPMRDATQPGGFGSQGVTHFSSVYSAGDLEAADDLIAGDDVTVGDVVTAADVTVTDDVTVGDVVTAVDVTATGDLTVGDDATVTDALSTASLAVSSAGTVGTFLNVTGVTAISCTDAGVITMTGTYQPLESAGTVTPTLSTSATGVTTGTLLCLINTADTTINLADAGTAMLGGARALGQYDSLWLIFDGTNWVEISTTDN